MTGTNRLTIICNGLNLLKAVTDNTSVSYVYDAGGGIWSYTMEDLSEKNYRSRGFTDCHDDKTIIENRVAVL